MRAKVYLRVARGVKGQARGRTYVSAATKVNHEPLSNAQGSLPTVAFAVEFDIPEALLMSAENVIAEIKVAKGKAEIAAEVKQP